MFLVTSEITWVKLGELPTPRSGVLVLLVVPIWGALFAELLALGYIVLGNPILIQIIGIGAISGVLGLVSRGKIMSSTAYLIKTPILPIMVGLAGLLATFYLIDNMDKEWLIEKWKHSAS